jgi:hypothetical protein
MASEEIREVSAPPNKQMQRTRHGQDGASPLICVFSVPNGEERGKGTSATDGRDALGAAASWSERGRLRLRA